MKTIWFVTGSDTAVGKTVFAVLWTRFLIAQGLEVRPLKPICSGGRRDVEDLASVLPHPVDLDDLNPWSFFDPVSPALAATRSGRRVRLTEVVDHCRKAQSGMGDLVIEGAGGLLSPLGEDFDNRDLLLALDAIPLVVCPNRLGVIGQARLVREALPPLTRDRSAWILNCGVTPDVASSSNPDELARFIPPDSLFLLPQVEDSVRSPLSSALLQSFSRLLARYPLPADLPTK